MTTAAQEGATFLGAQRNDAPLARLLSHHFGDRSVYFVGEEDRALLPKAVAMGLVSKEGSLTHRGYHTLHATQTH